MKRRLTDRTLKSLPPAISKRRHYDLMDDLVQGFGVRVHMDGRKTFILIARYPGSRHPTRRALGQYENGMSLESARKKAGVWRQLLADGIDPRIEIDRQRKEEARARSDSFASVVEAYVAHIRRAKYRSVRDVERCLEREFTSRWAKRPIREISRRDVIEVLDAIVKRDAPYAAHNALAHLRSLFNWACDRYSLDVSPCDRIKPSRVIGTKKARQRTLSDDEVRAFWNSTGKMGYPWAPLFRLLLLTGQRRDEVGGARWPEFDLKAKVWTVPAERFKAGSNHIVPLTDDALAILEALPRFRGDFLFSTTAGAKPCSGFSKAKRILDKGMPGSDWRLHDIRRTVRTGLAALKIPDVTAEMVIGHGRRGIQRVYDQHNYLDEVREALTLWAGRLRDIVRVPPDNLIRLKTGR